MTKRNKNKRKEPKRTLRPPNAVPVQQEYELEVDRFISKKEKENTINKRYLILCEGETEEAYFSGLKNNILLRDKFQAVEIEIVSPSHKVNPDPQTTLRDNSLKGLVWEAMKRKKQAKRERNPFDEIWIIIDNDERNSYVISKTTLQKTKNSLSTLQLSTLSNYLDSFFLSDRHYIEFLKNQIGLNQQKTSTITSLSTKNRLFEDYLNPNPKHQFFKGEDFTYGQGKKIAPLKSDFDNTWKTWLKKAYSCRTFEHWLILHFEACKIPFTISKEFAITKKAPFNPNNSIHHLWKFVNNYNKGFATKKGNKIDAYNILKPQPYNQKYETEKEAQAVIDKINTAILNSLWLRNEMATELAIQGGRYYEVNPYTDVDYLLCSLLEKEVSFGTLNHSIPFDDLQITCSFDNTTNDLQITIINQSADQRLLINNTNVCHFFKIMTIDKDHLHKYIDSTSISNTVNILPQNQSSFSVSFSSIPQEEKSYLLFQSRNPNKHLYFPI